MHPHRNPNVAGPLTGETQNNAEKEEIPEDDCGVLHVQTGPDEGSEDQGENEPHFRFPPSSEEDAAEDELFHQGSGDGHPEKEENGEVGGICHFHHGIVHFFDPETGAKIAEENAKSIGHGSPDRPMPPLDSFHAKVFPASPMWADFSQEPTRRADHEDCREGGKSRNIPVEHVVEEEPRELIVIEEIPIKRAVGEG